VNEASPTRDYLVFSVLATIFCCLPLGLVGIFYAAQTRGALVQGDEEIAQRCSRKARGWIIASVVLGAIFWLAFAVVLVLLGGLSHG